MLIIYNLKLIIMLKTNKKFMLKNLCQQLKIHKNKFIIHHHFLHKSAFTTIVLNIIVRTMKFVIEENYGKFQYWTKVQGLNLNEISFIFQHTFCFNKPSNLHILQYLLPCTNFLILSK